MASCTTYFVHVSNLSVSSVILLLIGLQAALSLVQAPISHGLALDFDHSSIATHFLDYLIVAM